MARKFLTPIDLNSLELQNFIVHNLASAPTAAKGRMYLDSANNLLKVSLDGSTFATLSTGGGSFTLGSTSISLGSTTTSVSGLTLSTSSVWNGNTIAIGYGGTGTTDGSITGTGALTFTAGGTNTNVVLAPNGTGSVNVSNKTIINVATPVNDTDAANKAYVDNVSLGVNAHDAVVALISGTIAGTYTAGTTGADGGTGVGAYITYTSTGTTTVDTTVTLAQYDRVLVTGGVTADSGANSKANGIYIVSTAGSTGVATVLTRALDFDNSIFGDVASGDLVYITSGTANGGTQWVQTVKGTATSGSGVSTRYCVKIDTDAISFTQFSGVSSTTAGAGLVKNGNAFDVNPGTGIAISADAVIIDTAWAGQTAITTLGTVTTGTWNAGVVAGQYGGTGVANTGKTITLGGNLTTTTAAISLAANASGSTVTLPATGTLATLAGSEALTNKTYNKLSITAPSTGAGLVIADLKTFTVNNSITLATLTGADNLSFTFPSTSATIARTDAAQTFTGNQTIQAGSTQDAVKIAGRAGGTSSYAITLTPATLSGSSTLTLPSATSSTTFTVARTLSSTIALTAGSNGTITHNMNNQYVLVQMFDSSNILVDMDVTLTDANTVTVQAQTTATYRYVIIGQDYFMARKVLTTLDLNAPLTLTGAAGSSGQVLTSGGAGTTPTWTTPSSGSATGAGLYALDYISGNWYSGPITSRAGSTPAFQVSYVFPFIAGKDQTFTKLATYLTGINANCVLTLGVYNSTSTGFPQTLMASGTVTGDTLGIRSVTGLSISMTKGSLYWLAININGITNVTGLVLPVASTATNPLFFSAAQPVPISGTGNVNGFGVSSSTSLPSTWSSTTAFATVPVVYIGYQFFSQLSNNINKPLQ